MKNIMAKESSECPQGVPTYIYKPGQQGFIFEKPLDELCDMLLDEFTGDTLTMIEIYKRHSVGKRYIGKNYKDALMILEKNNKIQTYGRKSTRGFADSIKVIFP